MITEIIVPDLGAVGGEVVITEWLIKEGEPVVAGQPLFVLETDKATHEVEAFRSGYLRRILTTSGETVEIGAVVAFLTDKLDEPIESEAATVADQPELPRRNAVIDHAPTRPRLDSSRDRPLASPAARRLARERGVDLGTIAGSGRRGEIHIRDVNAVAPSRAGAEGVSGRRVRLSPMRRSIARTTLQSKTHIPHFYAGLAIDMTAAFALRARWKTSMSNRPTVNDMIVLAAAQALRRTPKLNATFHETEIQYHDAVNIGVVIAIAEGMLVPTVFDADKHDIFELATITGQLKQRAIAGKLTGKELGGATLGISNLGMMGLDLFVAVINPPHAAILACGAANPQPVVHDGRVVVRTMMNVTLSVDHRVADGIVAAQFLSQLRRYLEHPSLFLQPDATESEA